MRRTAWFFAALGLAGVTWRSIDAVEPYRRTGAAPASSSLADKYYTDLYGAPPKLGGGDFFEGERPSSGLRTPKSLRSTQTGEGRRPLLPPPRDGETNVPAEAELASDTAAAPTGASPAARKPEPQAIRQAAAVVDAAAEVPSSLDKGEAGDAPRPRRKLLVGKSSSADSPRAEDGVVQAKLEQSEHDSESKVQLVDGSQTAPGMTIRRPAPRTSSTKLTAATADSTRRRPSLTESIEIPASSTDDPQAEDIDRDALRGLLEDLPESEADAGAPSAEDDDLEPLPELDFSRGSSTSRNLRRPSPSATQPPARDPSDPDYDDYDADSPDETEFGGFEADDAASDEFAMDDESAAADDEPAASGGELPWDRGSDTRRSFAPEPESPGADAAPKRRSARSMFDEAPAVDEVEDSSATASGPRSPQPESRFSPRRPASGSATEGAVRASEGAEASLGSRRPRSIGPRPATTRASANALPPLSAVETRTAAAVTAKWNSRGAINIGQECVCELVVHNGGDMAAEDIEVEAILPTTVEFLDADPQPEDADGALRWRLDQLDAGASQVLALRLIPRERGAIATQASVRFSNMSAGRFTVAEPMLAIELNGPGDVLLGETATHLVTIRNPGSGLANNVRVEARIPEGLEHSRGARLMTDLGSLNPGESRPIRLPLIAVGGGRHLIQVNATAEGGLSQSAAAEVMVVAPTLSTELEGPSRRFLGRQATYQVHVACDGAAPAENVRVMYKVPEEFEFVSSERGAQFDEASRILSWFLGPVNRGETVSTSIVLKATQLGSATHFVRATGERGVVSDAQVTTRVDGTASLSLEIKDLEDPVEVAAETVYEIRVNNEGSAPAEGITLTCELPQRMSLVTADGPTKHRSTSQQVAFQPIAELAPGESEVFRVHVTCEAGGRLRFRAKLASKSIGDPIESEEMTQFYDE